MMEIEQEDFGDRGITPVEKMEKKGREEKGSEKEEIVEQEDTKNGPSQVFVEDSGGSATHEGRERKEGYVQDKKPVSRSFLSNERSEEGSLVDSQIEEDIESIEEKIQQIISQQKQGGKPQEEGRVEEEFQHILFPSKKGLKRPQSLQVDKKEFAKSSKAFLEKAGTKRTPEKNQLSVIEEIIQKNIVKEGIKCVSDSVSFKVYSSHSHFLPAHIFPAKNFVHIHNAKTF